MKYIVTWGIVIAGFVLALYTGIWTMFINPIMQCCKAYDSGDLTGFMIGITIIKCVFAAPVARLITYVTGAIGKYLIKFW